MGMNLAMRAHFEKADLEQVFDFRVVFGDPTAGHEECGGDLVLDQIVDQRLVISRPLSDGAQIEGQRNAWTGGRTRLDDLRQTVCRHDEQERHRCSEKWGTYPRHVL